MKRIETRFWSHPTCLLLLTLYGLLQAPIPLAAQDWLPAQTIAPPGVQAGDHAGWSLAMSDDTLAVASLRLRLTVGDRSGVVDIFRRIENSWTPAATLAPPAGEDLGLFGWSVALDGDTLAVGAIQETVGADVHAGAVYVYRREEAAGDWTLEERLTAGESAPGANFGYAVDVSGSTLVVGARFHPVADDESGSAYVFQRSDTGDWSQVSLLAAGQPTRSFGAAVAIDDRTIVVGAPEEDLAGLAGAGAAYVFTRPEGDPAAWSPAVPPLTAPAPAVDGRFGYDVAADGGTLAVSALPLADSPTNGTVFVYADPASDPIVLTGDASMAGFGRALSLQENLLLVGAAHPSSPAGQAVIFIREAGAWSAADTVAPDPPEADLFGWDVALTDRLALVGAPQRLTGGIATGSAFLYGLAPVIEGLSVDGAIVTTATLVEGESANLPVIASNEPGLYEAVNLPNGLAIDAGTGVISGVPAPVEGGPWIVEDGLIRFDSTVTATNEVAAAGRDLIFYVEDATPPVITLLGEGPSILECPAPYVEPGANALDLVDGDLSDVITIDASAVMAALPGTYPVTYDVTDTAGNPAVQVTRMVTVQDTTPPVITLLGDNPQIIEAPGVYMELGATAADSCEGDVSDAIVIDATAVDASTPGTYTVTYNVSDSQGNAAIEATRSVVVEDTTAPIISLSGDNPLILECPEPYVEPGATATDSVDGDLSAEVTIDASAVDWETPGIYDVTYNVTDASGNPAVEVIRSVVVQDTIGPVVTLLGDNPQVVIIPGEDYIEMGATAEDACEGAIEIIEIDASAINLAVPGDYPVIYTASDSAGNESEPVTRTVSVRIDPSLRVFYADFDADPEVVSGIEGVSVSYDWAGITTEESVEGYAGIGAERPDGGFDGLFLRNATPFPGDSITLAISSEDFDGPENPSGEWTYGYRNVEVSIDPDDYDPVADFIPFDEADGWVFDGSWFQDADAGPSDVEIGSTLVVPDVDGEDPTLTQWAIRRWTASFTGRVQIDWQMIGMIEPCGTGVTGAVHLNGVRVDSATIPSDTSVSRTVYLEVAAGDVVDLIHSPRGLDGVVDEVCDNIDNNMTIIATPQPVSTTLQLVGLDSLPAGHTEIDVNFLLAVIDRWDGTLGEGAADFLEISIAEIPDFEWRYSFDNSAEFAEEPATVNAPEGGVQLAFREDLGFSPAEDDFADSAYAVSLSIPRDALSETDSLTITWRSRGSGWEGTEDEFADESWAIENVEVSFRDPTMMGVVAGEPPSPAGLPGEGFRLSGEPSIEIDAITGGLRLFWRPAAAAVDASDAWIEYSPTLEPGSWNRLSEGPIRLLDGWSFPIEPENHADIRRGFYRIRAEAKAP